MFLENSFDHIKIINITKNKKLNLNERNNAMELKDPFEFVKGKKKSKVYFLVLFLKQWEIMSL